MAACPRLNSVWSSAGTFSAPRGSQAGSLGPAEASECDPRWHCPPEPPRKSPAQETQDLLLRDPRPGPAGSPLLSSRSRGAAGTAPPSSRGRRGRALGFDSLCSRCTSVFRHGPHVYPLPPRADFPSHKQRPPLSASCGLSGPTSLIWLVGTRVPGLAHGW